MSIQEEIERISNAKEDIKEAIRDKGVQVSDDELISDYPQEIAKITGGGGIPDVHYQSNTSIIFDVSSNPESSAYGPVTVEVPEGLSLTDIQIEAVADGEFSDAEAISKLIVGEVHDHGYAQVPITINNVDFPTRVWGAIWSTRGYTPNYVGSMGECVYSGYTPYKVEWDDAVLVKSGVTISFGNNVQFTCSTYFIPVSGLNDYLTDQGYIPAYVPDWTMSYKVHTTQGSVGEYSNPFTSFNLNGEALDLASYSTGNWFRADKDQTIALFAYSNKGTVAGYTSGAWQSGDWGFVVFVLDGHTLDEVLGYKPLIVEEAVRKGESGEKDYATTRKTPQVAEVKTKLDTLIASNPRTLTFAIPSGCLSNLAFHVKAIVSGEVALSQYVNNGKSITVKIMDEWGDETLDQYSGLLLAPSDKDISDIEEVKVGIRDMD